MKFKIHYLFLLFAPVAGAQVITLPDANFKAALLAADTMNGIALDSSYNAIVVDANANGEIEQSEADAVWFLYVDGLNIASLEGISYFKNLRSVDCSDNQLTEADFSGCPYLDHFHCENNYITQLNIKNGVNQSGTYGYNLWGGNPITYVCTDYNETDTVLSLLVQNGYPDGTVSVNTYCSFTPGGDYNTLTGKLTYDADNNGCGPSDQPFCFMKLALSDGSYVYTDVNGNYNFYKQAGTFTVTPAFENPDFFTLSQPSATEVFPVVDNTVATNNFCISSDGASADLEVVMAPLGKAAPGMPIRYKLIYKNKGNSTLYGSVTCSWNTALFTISSIYPVQSYSGSNTYHWSFYNLKPFEHREIIINLVVNNDNGSNPVYSGDVIPFTANISFTGTDQQPADNSFVFNQKIESTVQQNFIQCLEGESLPATEMGEYLHYMVSFANTGTEVADNVVITQDIDPDMFDVSTLEILNSSHNLEARVTNNRAVFAMQNASIVNGNGHGDIIYKIKTKPHLQISNNLVTSRATINFDYRLPTATNTATTTFGTMSVDGQQKDDSVIVYPNPTVGKINIKADGVIKNVSVYDIQGRLLQSEIISTNETAIDLSSKATGVYLVKVATERGVMLQKIIKE